MQSNSVSNCLSLVWLQTELDSTQSYYHYLLRRLYFLRRFYFLQNVPSLWLIFPAMYSTWFVQVKSDEIKIPRYLKQVTLFTQWSKIDTVRATSLSGFLLLPMSILSKRHISIAVNDQIAKRTERENQYENGMGQNCQGFRMYLLLIK